ncbi:uncharacterized protein DS421_17g586980 [Arachis hypogaea]|nr:uncharacterized protein DS421_17g586980 [Arachis hypogaea]
MACHLKAEAWHANYWNQGKIMSVARQPLGVTRWYKFTERMNEANYMGHATWYQSRGTPLTILHLGVLLESRHGTPVSFREQISIGTCHLSSWRATPNRGTTHSQRDVVRQTLGVPR